MKHLSKHQLTPNANRSYKIGVDEIVDLKDAMQTAMRPVLTHLNDLQSWTYEPWFTFEDAEYKSRDGFIAHSHNCGGVLIDAIVPECGSRDFDFLEFGTVERTDSMSDEEYDNEVESQSGDGFLDCRLYIWLKFEGINENDELQFYLVASGGNGDAPYFRIGSLDDIFESSFTCKSVQGVKRTASKYVKALIASLGGAESTNFKRSRRSKE